MPAPDNHKNHQDEMKEIVLSAHLIYARTTDRVPVTVVFPPNWSLEAPFTCIIGKATHQVTASAISLPEGRTPRILSLHNGDKIFIDAKLFPASLDPHRWAKRLERAERGSLPVLVAISLVLLSLFGALGYWALPKLSDKFATLIPNSVISEISQATLSHLDQLVFDDSQLPDKRQEVMRNAFAELRAIADLPDDVRLLFRASPILGANALALPGGPVVLLDELVEIAPSDEGIYGVLAHELAHIALAHNRKQLARDSLFSLIAIMTGTAQDLSSSTAIAKTLIFSGYSREFEAEADTLARAWIEEAGYDLQAFDEMLVALYQQDCKQDCPDAGEGRASSWFDSHPSLSERLSLQAQ